MGVDQPNNIRTKEPNGVKPPYEKVKKGDSW